MCLASIFGVGANTVAKADAEPEPSNRKVGVSVVEGGLWADVTNILGTGYDYYIEEANQVSTQIQQIEDFITDYFVDMLVVEPVVATDTSIRNKFYEACSRGITVIVIGDPYEGAHPDMIFLTQDYYGLGREHAQAILAEYLFEDDFLMHVYYYNDDHGNVYKSGMQSILDSSYNVTYISVNPFSQDVTNHVNAWFEDSNNPEVDEIVTYAGDILQRVLEIYTLDQEYTENTNGVGTGIRYFGDADRYTEYLYALANLLEDTIGAAFEGTLTENVIYYGFAPGTVKYVSR